MSDSKREAVAWQRRGNWGVGWSEWNACSKHEFNELSRMPGYYGLANETEYRELIPATTLDAMQAERDALRAEVIRLTQLVSGGKGGLPQGAIAWLDMGKGEASITFNKKADSNRASKRNAMELFNRVPAGYYPLYLSPQTELRTLLRGDGKGDGTNEVVK